MRQTTVATATLMLACLLAAAPASAIYVETPLRAHVSAAAAEVGDPIDVTIEPENETTAAQWGSQLVRAYYAYDTAEGSEDPGQETSNDTYRRVAIEDLTLDADARSTFRWTVPAEADDRNVAIRIESVDGELLAIADVAVGDAPPVMRVLAGGAEEGEPEPLPPVQEDASARTTDEGKNGVPGAGALAALMTLGVAAIAIGRRR